jgi:PTH1 family peptidyl-tRNA hydrolase
MSNEEHQETIESARERGTEPSPASQRFLIVGLGNPGRKYANTRHNVGFMLADRLAERWKIDFNTAQYKSMVGTGRFDNQRIILAKPQTYMNLSGDAVGPLANYYRIPTGNVLVAYDDIDLDFGTLRIRPKGGAGGHNGMRSIIHHLGHDFPRVRLGIGRPPGRMPPRAYVLRPFKGEEVEIVDLLLGNAAAATELFIRHGLEMAMNRYNGPVSA